MTRIVTFIEVFAGPHRFQLTVPGLSDFPDLLASCGDRIPKGSGVGVIKPRYSGTLERSYMSNGCCDCDALISEFYEHDAWHDEEATLGGGVHPLNVGPVGRPHSAPGAQGYTTTPGRPRQSDVAQHGRHCQRSCDP